MERNREAFLSKQKVEVFKAEEIDLPIRIELSKFQKSLQGEFRRRSQQIHPLQGFPITFHYRFAALREHDNQFFEQLPGLIGNIQKNS